jgi:REP element-mobilizing transposase RayT
MCRGNNREEIFFRDDGRRLFLHTLTEVCEQTGWLIHAYCLMTNHYHLLLETPEANPPPPRLRRDMSSSAKATAGHVWWKE